MGSFRWWCLVPLFAVGLQLRAISEDDAPGYRATYPTQVIQAEQLSIFPKHTRKGSCSYGDSSAFVSANMHESSSGTTDAIVGARRVHLGLGQKTAPRGVLYGILGCNVDYRGLKEWDWIGNAIIQPRLAGSNIARGTRYIIAINGRFSASAATGLHVGLYSEMGMRASIVHPLLGIDYTIGTWQIQAIYPIKAGLLYQGFRSHGFSLMVRPIYTALHLHKALHNRPGIGCYKATGLEFRWDYTPSRRWNLWAAVGSTITGTLTLGDSNNNHRHRIRLHRSPYFNVGVTCGI